MALQVTVLDTETGDEETKEIPEHDFLIICTGDCHIASTQAYPTKGTVVLTIKGRKR